MERERNVGGRGDADSSRVNNDRVSPGWAGNAWSITSVGRGVRERAREPESGCGVVCLFLRRPRGASQKPGESREDGLGRREGGDRAPGCDAGAKLTLAKSCDRRKAGGGSFESRLIVGVRDRDRSRGIGEARSFGCQEPIDGVNDRGRGGPRGETKERLSVSRGRGRALVGESGERLRGRAGSGGEAGADALIC